MNHTYPTTATDGEIKVAVPSFDEWFEARYGLTFDEAYMQPMMDSQRATKALFKELRAYSSWIAEQLFAMRRL